MQGSLPFFFGIADAKQGLRTPWCTWLSRSVGLINMIWELARGGVIWELSHVAPKLRGLLVSAAPP